MEMLSMALHGSVSVHTRHLKSEGFRNGPCGPRIPRDPSRVVPGLIFLVPSASRGVFARCTRFPTSVSSGEFTVLPPCGPWQ